LPTGGKLPFAGRLNSHVGVNGELSPIDESGSPRLIAVQTTRRRIASLVIGGYLIGVGGCSTCLMVARLFRTRTSQGSRRQSLSRPWVR
jgi:hypothetical protein